VCVSVYDACLVCVCVCVRVCFVFAFWCVCVCVCVPVYCTSTAYLLLIHCMLIHHPRPMHYPYTAYLQTIPCLLHAYSLPPCSTFTAYWPPIHFVFTAYSLPPHIIRILTPSAIPHPSSSSQLCLSSPFTPFCLLFPFCSPRSLSSFSWLSTIPHVPILSRLYLPSACPRTLRYYHLFTHPSPSPSFVISIVLS
jgi:hypothetical protein